MNETHSLKLFFINEQKKFGIGKQLNMITKRTKLNVNASVRERRTNLNMNAIILIFIIHV